MIRNNTKNEGQDFYSPAPRLFFISSIIFVLLIQSRHIIELVVRYRIELVLACRVMGILQVCGIGLSVIHILLLIGEVSIERLGSNAPATQVEVASVLHCQLQSAFPTQTLACSLLVLEVRLRIEGDVTLDLGVCDVLVYRVLGTQTDVVDDVTSLHELVCLDKSLSTHKHHVGVAEHIVVQCESLP